MSSPDQIAAFLAALSGGNVKAACKAAGWSRATAYRLRDSDIEFASAWEAALGIMSGVDDEQADQVEPDLDVAPDAEPVVDETPVPPAPAVVIPEADRARYRLTETAYIDDRLIETGAVITFDGVPGPHMTPVNPAARAAKGLSEGAQSDDEIAAFDFVAEATVRDLGLAAEIDTATSRLLAARALQFDGSTADKSASRAGANVLEIVIGQKSRERAELAATVARAQDQIVAAQVAARKALERRYLEKNGPALDARLALAQNLEGVIAAAAMLLARTVLAPGDQVWGEITQLVDLNVASSCVPDRAEVGRSLLGLLMRCGAIDIDAILGLSELGLRDLRRHPPMSEVVAAQNSLLTMRFAA